MQSDFLKGKTERKFACNFDWIFNSENFVKILENKYKNRDDVNIEQKQGLSKDEEMFNGKRTYMRGINRTIIPDDAPPTVLLNLNGNQMPNYNWKPEFLDGEKCL